MSTAATESKDVLGEKIKRVKDFYNRIMEQAKSKYAKYTEFISELQQAVKIVHEGREYYISVRVPYMTVAGRIAEAVDEHLKENKKISYKTVCETVGDETVLVKVIVESEIRGYSEGIVKLGKKVSKTGQDYSYEDAETSALGRALAKLGYGLVGQNIASYEEAIMKGVEGATDTDTESTEGKGNGGTVSLGTREKMKKKKELMDQGLSEAEAEAKIKEEQEKKTDNKGGTDGNGSRNNNNGGNSSIKTIEINRTGSKSQAVLKVKNLIHENVDPETEKEILRELTKDPKDYEVFERLNETFRMAGFEVKLVD